MAIVSPTLYSRSGTASSIRPRHDLSNGLKTYLGKRPSIPLSTFSISSGVLSPQYSKCTISRRPRVQLRELDLTDPLFDISVS
jgi:hypothetical protein